MENKNGYWAQRRQHSVGPYPTRDEALSAFRAAFPFTGPDYEARAKRNSIMTGRGVYGLHFHIEWHPAREDTTS